MSWFTRKFQIQLWREDLDHFYTDLLKTVVNDFSDFDKMVDICKDDQKRMRKLRTAVLIGMAVSREKIFDKRYILGKLLGPKSVGAFAERWSIDCLLDAILLSPETAAHLKGAQEWVDSKYGYENDKIHSVDRLKMIKIAMMRAAIRRQSSQISKVTYFGPDVEVVW